MKRQDDMAPWQDDIDPSLLNPEDRKNLELLGALELPPVEDAESPVQKKIWEAQLLNFRLDVRDYLEQYRFFGSISPEMQDVLVSAYVADLDYELEPDLGQPVIDVFDAARPNFEELTLKVAGLERIAGVIEKTRGIGQEGFERALRGYIVSSEGEPLQQLLEERVDAAVGYAMNELPRTPSLLRDIHRSMERRLRDAYAGLKTEAKLAEFGEKLADPNVTGSYESSLEALIDFLKSASFVSSEISAAFPFMQAELAHQAALKEFSIDPYALLKRYGIECDEQGDILTDFGVNVWIDVKAVESRLMEMTNLAGYVKESERLLQGYIGSIDVLRWKAARNVEWLRPLVQKNAQVLAMTEVPHEVLRYLTIGEIQGRHLEYVKSGRHHFDYFSELEQEANKIHEIALGDFISTLNGLLQDYFELAAKSPEEREEAIRKENLLTIAEMTGLGINVPAYLNGPAPEMFFASIYGKNSPVTLSHSSKDLVADISLGREAGRPDLLEADIVPYLKDYATQFVEIAWGDGRKGYALYFAAIDESGNPVVAIDCIEIKEKPGKNALREIAGTVIDYIAAHALNSGFKGVVVGTYEDSIAGLAVNRKEAKSSPVIYKIGAMLNFDITWKEEDGRQKVEDYVVVR